MYHGQIIDAHFHAYAGKDCTGFLKSLQKTAGLSASNIVSVCKGLGYDHFSYNPEGLAIRRANPGMVYLFAGLDYTDKSYLQGKVDLAAQVQKSIAAGADGIKMLEGKPDVRKALGIALDSTIFDALYTYLETEKIPLLMHVADPEEFWDPLNAPAVAKQFGWCWGDGTYATKESLYHEAEGVLGKHPRLKITFAHFYFLSADIAKASAFLDRWQNVSLDITPGWEMYDNFAGNSTAWREFFTKYRKRIIFGTDNFPAAKGTDQEQLDKSRQCITRIRQLLETPDPCFTGHGLHLDESVLADIYRDNFLNTLKRK